MRDGGGHRRPDVRAVWRMVDELDTAPAERFDATRQWPRCGEAGVVEVVATAGYYTTLA